MYSLSRSIAKVLKTGVYDYCNIDSNDSEDLSGVSFINKDNSHSTLIEIKGSRSVIGFDRFESIVTTLSESLAGILSKPGYKIDYYYKKDPYASGRLVDKSIIELKETATALNLDFQSILDERRDLLSKRTISEECFIVLTTLPSTLDPKILKDEIKKRSNKVDEIGANMRSGEFASSMHIGIQSLREIHYGFVSSYMQELKSVDPGLDYEQVEAHGAINIVRRLLCETDVSDEWRPRLLGDKMTPRNTKESGLSGDISHILNPNIAMQVFSQAPRIHPMDTSLVEMGNSVIAPLMVDLSPQDPKPFQELISRIDESVPWMINFSIMTGHDKLLSKIGGKNSFATLLSKFSSSNVLIRDAATELIDMAREGEKLAAMAISLSTWGKDIIEAKSRKQILLQQASNWGSMNIIEERGDAIQAWLDTIPMMTKKNLSIYTTMPLFDIFEILPVAINSSPWDMGSMLYRTLNKKLYPLEPFSTKQSAWSEISFAPPGYGKSFELAASNLALILKPGTRSLPRISTIDIGYAGASGIKFIADALPDTHKYLVRNEVLEMDKKYLVNILDTPLGNQYPLKLDRDFAIGFMSALLTPVGSNSISRMSEITGRLVDEMYDYFSEENNPKKYERNINYNIDDRLDDIGFFLEEDEVITWYQISKILFDKEEYSAALAAHRQAVPNMNDATTVLAASTSIRDLYGEAQHSGENTVGILKGMLSSAASDYPILFGPTVFDFGEARICRIDLQKVALSGSPKARKQTSLMYLLARQVMCRTFYHDLDMINQFDEHFREFHKKQIASEQGIPKRLNLDEFHRTEGAEDVRQQTIRDVREGRKFDVSVKILSQLLDDFDMDLVGLVDNVHILSRGKGETDVNKIKSKFDPSDDALALMKRYCTGPTSEGSSILYLGTLKDGPVEMILRLTLGSGEMWAYSSTKNDVLLREAMITEIGFSETLTILSRMFPKGSAVEYINRVSQEIVDPSVNKYEYTKDKILTEYRKAFM